MIDFKLKLLIERIYQQNVLKLKLETSRKKANNIIACYFNGM